MTGWPMPNVKPVWKAHVEILKLWTTIRSINLLSEKTKVKPGLGGDIRDWFLFYNMLHIKWKMTIKWIKMSKKNWKFAISWNYS